jgi:hypothetical protein
MALPSDQFQPTPLLPHGYDQSVSNVISTSF